MMDETRAREEIVEIARGVIAEVKETGSAVEMEPMTAFERKIVHDEGVLRVQDR